MMTGFFAFVALLLAFAAGATFADKKPRVAGVLLTILSLAAMLAAAAANRG
jgi:hypothetical protein